MASRINMATVTFSGKEIQALRETFFTAVFQNPALEQFHTVVTGVKAKMQMIWMGQFGLTGKKQTSCTVVPNASQIPTTEKFWDPEYIGDRMEECFIDLLDTFFAWSLKNGVQKPDLTNTDFALFLEDRFSLAAFETALRFAWLGNKTADNVSDGGYLKNGVDPEYFTAINGFWVQALAIAAATPSRRITIAENAGANYAAQGFDAADIAAGTATAYLESMIYGADMRLRSATDKVIVATQSLVDEYVRERKKVANSEIAYERVENGIATVMIDGITIIPFDFLDRHIRAYEDNGTKWNNPHRAILTTISNLQIGTEEVENLTELDPFYDKTAKKYIVDYGFNLDAKIAEDHLVVVAY